MKKKIESFEDLIIWQKAIELRELRSQLYLAREVGYLENEEHVVFREKTKFLSCSIWNHMKSISAAS